MNVAPNHPNEVMNSPAKPLRLAIVGCGTVAQVNYSRTLPRVAGIEVTLVSDLRTEAAEALASKMGARVATFEQILEQADAVIVATPPSSHFELVRRALERVPLVVCEKPFVPTVREARELVVVAERTGHRLLVGHFRRTFAALRMARELVQTGVMGRVTAIDIAEGGRFAWEAESGYVFKDPFGGVLFDTGSHSIDMALYVTLLDGQKIEPIVHQVVRDRAEPSHEIRAEVTLRTPSGEVDLLVRLSRYRALANRLHVTFERGSLDVSVGPRGNVRLNGPSGSTVLHAVDAHNDFDLAFIDQWYAMFGQTGADVPFRAERFVGLTAVIEAIAKTE